MQLLRYMATMAMRWSGCHEHHGLHAYHDVALVVGMVVHAQAISMVMYVQDGVDRACVVMRIAASMPGLLTSLIMAKHCR